MEVGARSLQYRRAKQGKNRRKITAGSCVCSRAVHACGPSAIPPDLAHAMRGGLRRALAVGVPELALPHRLAFADARAVRFRQRGRRAGPLLRLLRANAYPLSNSQKTHKKERRRWTYDIGRRVVALVLQLAVDLVIVEPVDAARSQPDGVAVQVVRLVPPAGRSVFTGCVTKQRARVAGESHQPVG